MTRGEAESFIDSCRESDATSIFTADTARKMYMEAGSPLEDIPVIHIAGTNGKGSVGNFIASALAACGIKTGLYSSPAVFSRWETVRLFDIVGGQSKESGEISPRITCTAGLKLGSIMSRNINDSEIGSITEKIKEISEKLRNKYGVSPSSFEAETILAFLAFKQWNVKAAVVECGMGGRDDATNVFTSPYCNVFTPVGMDHSGVLGPTLKDIAANKADIIRPGAAVISAFQNKDVRDVFKKTASERGAAGFSEISDGDIQIIEMVPGESTFICDGHEYTIHMNGRAQIKNAALSVRVLESLKKRPGFENIRYEYVRNGLISARIYGRWDIVRNDPLVILDGAHNPPAFQALSEFLGDYFKGKRFIFICGTFRDKDYMKNAEHIFKHSTMIYTVTAPGPRGMDGKELAEKINSLKDRGQTEALGCQNISEAYSLALEKLASGSDASGIVITGSLSIMREAYRTVTQN